MVKITYKANRTLSIETNVKLCKCTGSNIRIATRFIIKTVQKTKLLLIPRTEDNEKSKNTNKIDQFIYK